MKFAEIVFLLIVSGAAAALCIHGWLVEGYTALVILPPTGIAAVVVALAALRAWLTLKSAGDDARAALQAAYWLELRSTARPLLWCMAVLPLLLLLGYPLGLTVSAVAYARCHGGGWSGALLAGGFAFAVSWGLAGQVLGVPVNLLPGWLS